MTAMCAHVPSASSVASTLLDCNKLRCDTEPHIGMLGLVFLCNLADVFILPIVGIIFALHGVEFREKAFVKPVLIISVTNGCRFLTVVEVYLRITRLTLVVYSRRSRTVDDLSLHTHGKILGIVPEAGIGFELTRRER